MTPTQYAAREGITKQAAMGRLARLTPPPVYRRVKTQSGRYRLQIDIDPQAVYTPGRPGRPRKDTP
jgi:hypothetical protein